MPHVNKQITNSAQSTQNDSKDSAPHKQAPATPAANTPESRILTSSSKTWRLVATALVFGVLTAGQIVNTNDWFPLGTLSQYSYGRPLNSPTRSIGILAVTQEGQEVKVPLNTTGVGIGRAEIEGQAQRIIDDPSILEALARSWHGLHPDQPQYQELKMIRTTRYVEDGIPTGELETELLATWTVTGNYQRTQK